MNETFWGLYEAQISALRTCASSEEANMIMLETARLLVEHIDLSDATVSQYDKFGIRKLFAVHNALGGAITSFYEKEREHLDPAAQNGAIGQKMADVSRQITSTAEALKTLQEREKELFAKEDELISMEKELEEWKQKATHLKEIDAIAAAQIQRYQEQYDQLEAAIAEHNDELAFWEAHLGEDSSIISKMKSYGVTSIDSLLSIIEKLKTNIRQDLRTLDEVLKRIVDQEDQIRVAVFRKQNKMV